MLDATIECLVEYGYADTTTARVSERAGVSRGAQVHHFPSKADLVAEAVSHLAARRAEQLSAEAKRLPHGPERITAALDLLWQANVGPMQEAALELWTAARTDPELRAKLVPVERDLVERYFEFGRMLFGEFADRPDFERRFAVALSAIQGYAMVSAMLASSKRDRTTSWKRRRDEIARLFL